MPKDMGGTTGVTVSIPEGIAGTTGVTVSTTEDMAGTTRVTADTIEEMGNIIMVTATMEGISHINFQGRDLTDLDTDTRIGTSGEVTSIVPLDIADTGRKKSGVRKPGCRGRPLCTW